MSFASREQILAAKRRTIEVDCPELGGLLKLREVSLGQLRAFDPKDDVAVLSQMIVDEAGNLMFADPDGLAALREVRVAALMPLIEAASKLNGAVEDVAKNSAASTNGASESDSQGS